MSAWPRANKRRACRSDIRAGAEAVRKVHFGGLPLSFRTDGRPDGSVTRARTVFPEELERGSRGLPEA